MARLGIGISDQAMERLKALCARHDLSQGKLYEALLSAPDEVADKVISDWKETSRAGRPKKVALLNTLRALSTEELLKLVEGLKTQGM